MRRKEIEARLTVIFNEITTRGAELTEAELTALETEVEGLQEERKALDTAKEKRNSILAAIAAGNPLPTDSGNPAPAPTLLRSFAPPANQGEVTEIDKHDTPEYRKAFMDYVCRGVAIPKELRANEITTTGDTGAVIPTTILNEIITKLSTYGNIWSKVRKLNMQGGVAIPILSIKPEATWIGETTPSEDKKMKLNEKIIFNYYGVECKIAQSLLANIVTLKMFQDLFVPMAAEAIVRAVEKAIFRGNGTSQPLGILKDTRIPEINTITLTTADIGNWSTWKKKVFARMKKAYRKGTFYTAQGTFDGYIDGMVDINGQPIGRINYGLEGGENYRFGGKVVETVEDEIIANYEDAAEGDIIAVFIDFNNYAVNSNLEMQTVKWVDNDTNEVKNKCILICDGKLVDPNGVLIIKKGGDIQSA